MRNQSVTIITVCRNAENEISRTIESVFTQDYGEIEHLIIDGKSTDATVKTVNDFIEKNTSNKIQIISEKDSGIYNAMNKGIDIAKGEWLLFLNAGDTFYSDSAIKNLLAGSASGSSFVYGDANYIDNSSSYTVKHRNIDTIKESMPFCHQAIMGKRDVFLRYRYDEQYKICADYDLFLRAYLGGEHFAVVDSTICNYEVGGFSQKNQLRLLKEYSEIKYKNGIIRNKTGYYNKMKIKYTLRSFCKRIVPDNLLSAIRKRLYTQENKHENNS